MSTLYELTNDFMALLDMADDPDIEEQVWLDTAIGIEGALENKADGYAKVIKQLIADADAAKSEKERLSNREKSLRNRADSLKKMLQDTMEVSGKLKFKTQLFSFGIQKNAPALKILDEEQIPEDYLIPQPPKVDSAGIKDFAKKNGGELKDADGNVWARLEQSQSLRIR